ncbi:SAM-dependent methyltransferase [Gloeomargarita lithophora Alchichica-D10]|uniref:SAM-dependent methyltransferase n=1 Tax=Gloeomargarita lithophora Alchichica-D10 TaxID=1188229 RepID=A0A1J0AEV9_9CYAN|nr:class I SAM-dependent methyltransferase [Gloeomargarita lithophora]APB34478.1 SAM-dependent methyltransferase [Gloeomargarita lithophora Alchichica-D10]
MSAPVLTPDQRQKLDTSDDQLFYDFPRLVTHVDAGFIQKLTQLYRERLTPGGKILDLMSSWVAHLPPEMAFSEVVGHGMNQEELAKNPRLNRYFVQNLNQNQKLPLEDNTFDAVLNTVSVQYLQHPEPIFQEIYRILKPGGTLIVSFSNRMFYQKAIQVWREGTDQTRIQLVKQYIQGVPGFSKPEVVIQNNLSVNPVLALLGLGVSDPFFAILAHKQEDI